MKIIVDGKQFTNFTRASVTRSLGNLTDQFEFDVATEKSIPIPFTGGESCEISVDGIKVLTGFIEDYDIFGDETSHQLNFFGRDKTCDITDSKLIGLGQIAPPIKFKTLIDIVIANLQLDIEVIDRIGVEPFVTVEDMPKSEPGMNAQTFIEKLSRKRQVLLSSDPDGNLEITRSIGNKIQAFITHRIDGVGNNVLNYSANYKRSTRFRRYVVTGQASMNAEIGSENMSSAAKVDQTAEDFDLEIRLGRTEVISGESPTSIGEAKKRATWQANFNKSKSFTYQCDVDGWRNQTGDLWEPNTIVNILSEPAGINASMLLDSVSYSLSQGTGRVTTLGFLDENAYSLELSQPETSKTGKATVEIPLPDVES